MPVPVRALSLAPEPRSTGVILAIDYGKKRLGLALSDEFCVTSRPYATWTRINRRRDLARLRELVRKERVRRIVVGLPLHLDGRPSEMSEEARSFAERVGKAVGVPVEMVDERLTSWEAERLLEETQGRSLGDEKSGGAGKKKKARSSATVDAVAAAVILKEYLERQGQPAGKSGDSNKGSGARLG